MHHLNEKRVAKLRVGRTEGGFLLRVEGRGTVKLSPLLQEFTIRTLEAGPGESRTTIIVDLSACEYLDSTFLGCLLNLNRRFNRAGDQRFLITATTEARRLLLEPCNLDRVLDVRATSPEMVSETVELACPSLLNSDLGPHVLECHRRLAELDGPNKAAFQSIVEQLDGELAVVAPDSFVGMSWRAD